MYGVHKYFYSVFILLLWSLSNVFANHVIICSNLPITNTIPCVLLKCYTLIFMYIALLRTVEKAGCTRQAFSLLRLYPTGLPRWKKAKKCSFIAVFHPLQKGLLRVYALHTSRRDNRATRATYYICFLYCIFASLHISGFISSRVQNVINPCSASFPGCQ